MGAYDGPDTEQAEQDREFRQQLRKLQGMGVTLLIVNRYGYARLVRWADRMIRRFEDNIGRAMESMPTDGVQRMSDAEIVERRLGDTLQFRGKRLMILDEDFAAQPGVQMSKRIDALEKRFDEAAKALKG